MKKEHHKIGFIVNKKRDDMVSFLKTETHLSNDVSGSWIYFMTPELFIDDKSKSLIIISGDWHTLTGDYGYGLITPLFHYIQEEQAKGNITDLNKDLLPDLSEAGSPKRIWEILSGETGLVYSWLES